MHSRSAIFHCVLAFLLCAKFPCGAEGSDSNVVTAENLEYASLVVPASASQICSCRRGFEVGVDSTYFQLDNGFTNDFSPGNRIWLGYRINNDWSVRSRFWSTEFDSPLAGQSSNIVAGSPTTGRLDRSAIAVSHEFYTLDTELRRGGAIGNIQCEANLGLRYASRASQANTGGGTLLFDTDTARVFGVDSGIDVDAIGLTFGVDLRRALPSYKNLSVIGNLRGSIVGGEVGIDVNVFEVESSATGGQLGPPTVDTSMSINSQDVAVWIGQAQVGLEYSKTIRHSGPQFFARGMFEAQQWNSSEFQATIFNMPVSQNLNDSLLGFSFGVGLIR